MRICELVKKFEAAGRRVHLVGDAENGVLMALDVEGRLFAYVGGEVLNRVNEEAITGITTRKTGYINPGGDGFWPAPEGSRLGYEYSTGEWRVPPCLTAARWQVVRQSAVSALAEAEVDLVNASGVGVPCLLSRDITIGSRPGCLDVTVVEGIEYLGTRELTREEALIAPWSLCQFDCGPDCTLILPPLQDGALWDLYPWDSTCHRKATEKGIEVEMVTDFRFQLAMAPSTGWLHFVDRKRGFQIHRSAGNLAEGLDYIDIADADPKAPCSDRKIRFSAYCDPSGFMEMEAAGGAPATLKPGARTTLTVTTSYELA